MIPRLASANITQEAYARELFGVGHETLRKVPVQWRGFVLNHKHEGKTVAEVLDRCNRDPAVSVYDPQMTFDTYNGMAPE
jgi:hypothetical protein